MGNTKHLNMKSIEELKSITGQFAIQGNILEEGTSKVRDVRENVPCRWGGRFEAR